MQSLFEDVPVVEELSEELFELAGSVALKVSEAAVGARCMVVLFASFTVTVLIDGRFELSSNVVALRDAVALSVEEVVGELVDDKPEFVAFTTELSELADSVVELSATELLVRKLLEVVVFVKSVTVSTPPSNLPRREHVLERPSAALK
jgi:hypothetical protein